VTTRATMMMIASHTLRGLLVIDQSSFRTAAGRAMRP
jgi:hypothetical protein